MLWAFVGKDGHVQASPGGGRGDEYAFVDVPCLLPPPAPYHSTCCHAREGCRTDTPLSRGRNPTLGQSIQQMASLDSSFQNHNPLPVKRP